MFKVCQKVKVKGSVFYKHAFFGRIGKIIKIDKYQAWPIVVKFKDKQTSDSIKFVFYSSELEISND